jgi:hypothetical protein
LCLPKTTSGSIDDEVRRESAVVGASHDEGQRALSGIAFQPHCKLLGRGHELAGERPSLFPLRLCSALVASGTASK